MANYRDIDKKRVAFKGGFYLMTLVSFILSFFALRYAYRCLDWHFAVWMLIYIVIAVYLFFAIRTIRRRRGFKMFLAHVLMLQLVPISMSILTFKFVPEVSTSVAEPKYIPLTGKVGTYERYFNDMQDKQKSAALANGLPPFKSRADIEARYKSLRRDKKLVLIESNPKYTVRSLTYSSPYVVPKVEKLLEDIADSFQKKTQSKTKFVVTSVLRTEEDVKKLKRVNGNASTNSCHCNATTIDISYVRFEDDKLRPRDKYQLRLALAQTLHELRKESRCYVKIERKQYCYHITVR